MRSRGKLGGQHKVPRMDSTGTLTAELVAFLRDRGRLETELPERRNAEGDGSGLPKNPAAPTTGEWARLYWGYSTHFMRLLNPALPCPARAGLA